MRFWKGIEREDNVGTMTLFVESPIIDEDVIKATNEKLKLHPDCKRVYFGAGGVGQPTNLRRVEDVELPDVECVAEINENSPVLSTVNVLKFKKVIVTRLNNLMPKNAVFKVDNGRNLQVFTKDIEVDYSEVEDGKYSNDIEV